MFIKITSLYLGDIYKKISEENEFRPHKFSLKVTTVPYKENALLLKVGEGFVDIDTIKDEKDLKEKYNEVNALGEFRDGCGILKDTIPFFDSEGELYIEHDSIRRADYKGKVISLNKLKQKRVNNGENINYRR